ncbi:MAG: cell wall-binding repeat-containing protein [Oscillospiraceae bacterium]|nr:cell wall-binding repeat-containing protein [Oscillospiraceae bacterium]
MPVFAAPDDVINFPDDNLRKALADATYHYMFNGDVWDAPIDTNGDGKITQRELGQANTLELWNASISNLEGLQYAVNAIDVFLNGNIRDLSPLAGLTQVKVLEVVGGEVKNIVPLAGLTNLLELHLSSNEVSDITPLAKLTALRWLSLDNNEISDVSPLAALTELKVLNIWDNCISDMTPLAGLTQLTQLSIINNYIDIGENSIGLSVIKSLELNGVKVYYNPQTPLPFTRQSGSNRITTALNIAQTGWPTGAETVILTSGRGFADALAGGSLSASLDAPLLLTSNLPTGLEDDVLNTIKDLKAKNVVILGGTGTVSTDIEEALKAQGLDVERRSGGNRYETAVDIATALYENAEFDTVFLADGNNYPDALAGAPVSGILGQPILFTNSKDKNVREETLNFIEENGIKNVVILGGSSSVSDEVKKALEDKNIEVSRISGGNRYETALNIYNAYRDIFTGDTITITTGTNFPDALAGSAYSAKIGAPLFLLANTLNNANIRTAITSSGKEDFLVYGGSGSLSNAAVLRHVL